MINIHARTHLLIIAFFARTYIKKLLPFGCVFYTAINDNVLSLLSVILQFFTSDCLISNNPSKTVQTPHAKKKKYEKIILINFFFSSSSQKGRKKQNKTKQNVKSIETRWWKYDKLMSLMRFGSRK